MPNSSLGPARTCGKNVTLSDNLIPILGGQSFARKSSDPVLLYRCEVVGNNVARICRIKHA